MWKSVLSFHTISKIGTQVVSRYFYLLSGPDLSISYVKGAISPLLLLDDTLLNTDTALFPVFQKHEMKHS